MSNTWRFGSRFKSVGRRGTFEEDLQRCMSVAGAIKETCSSEMLRGPGADFLRGVAFWSIRSSVLGKMILRDRCSTSYDLASLSCGRLKEVSQNFFVFDVVNFNNGGRLAELLCFWRYQVQKLRKSRRAAAFLTLSTSKMKELSQNSFVFKLADNTTLHYTTLPYYNYNYNTNTNTNAHANTNTNTNANTNTNTTLHYTTLHYATLHNTTLITLQYAAATTTTTTTTTTATTIATTLHYAQLRYTNYTTLHCTTLHYTTPHHNSRHHTTPPLHYNYITLHYTTLITLQLQLPLQLQLHYFTLH